MALMHRDWLAALREAWASHAEAVDPLQVERCTERLLAADPARRVVLIRGSRAYRNSTLAARLLEVGHSRVHSEPRSALAAYQAAAQVARFLEDRPTHADLQAEALANLANCYRAVGALPQARRLMTRAESQMNRGSGDANLAARFAALTAALDVENGDCGAAEIGFRQAIDLYVELGENHRAAKEMLALGRCFLMEDDHEQSVRFLSSGLQMADLDQEPILTWTAATGLAKALGRMGRAEEGLQALGGLLADPLLVAVGGRANQVRVHWLMAELLLALGRGPEAEEIYRNVRVALADLGLPLDAALAGLDLATLYAEMGEDALVAAEASRALALLQEAGAEHHALKALRLLYEAACRKATTGAVVRYTARRLRAAPLRLAHR
jgi:tetratricopeptide (TPR) repeat protein